MKWQLQGRRERHCVDFKIYNLHVLFWGILLSEHSCVRKRFNTWNSLRDDIHAFVAKLSDRYFCWFLAAMLVPIQMGVIMASLYEALQIWVNHFSEYLAYEKLHWPESWWGSLHIYLLSSLRFWIFYLFYGFDCYFWLHDSENQQLADKVDFLT